MSPQGRLRRLAALVAAVFAAACALAPSAGATITDSIAPIGGSAAGPYASGEAIVRFEPGTTAADRREAREKADVEFDSTLEIPRAQVVEIDGSVEAAVRRLERQPGVAYAQPNYRYEALALDTFFGELWGLSDPSLPDPGVGVSAAWQDSRGNGQVIAVVDTGVDLTHPDLVGNLWTNPRPTRADLHGYDFVDTDGNPDDYDFHGTHVAGTAAAIADNGEGIAGVAPEAEIMAVRVLDGDGSGYSSDIASGIEYAAENGADVINLSLGGPVEIDGDGVMSDAVDFAATRGAIVVAAAGNSGTDNDISPTLPCALPQGNLICVAALAQEGGLAGFSNYGANSVDLAAPGKNILSAQTDYHSLFTEGFESGTAGWDLSTEPGSIPWGRSTLFSVGQFSVADSPAVGQRYAPDSDTQLIKSDPISLAGERGCRMHFDLRREIEPPLAEGVFFDEFFAGAVTSGAQDGLSYAGSSGGVFRAEEVSIADFDGEFEVSPAFALFSDATQEFDGAHVDNLRLLCRDQTYVPSTENYVAFNGTSMAAPHVSGVVALVRAAAPTASVTEVVNAILQGASAMPGAEFSRPTVTWGIADACQAIAVVIRDTTAVCPGSSRPVPPVPPSTPTSPAPVASAGFSGPASPRAKHRDKTRPQTQITKKPAKESFTAEELKRLVFRFASSENGSSFLCKIDRGRFHQCYRKLIRWFRVGEHVFWVKARDVAGNVDLTPAVYRFEIKQIPG